MGMQCQFQESDLPDDAIIGKMRGTADHERIISVNGDLLSANSDNGKDFWFDCGSASEGQIEAIKWLIRNRVCFNCA